MPDTIGRFKVRGKLATGGMGELFIVHDPHHPKEQALVLKLLHKHLADIEEFMEMFRQEGKLVVMMEHENIVRALEYGEVEGTPYILMRYYNGLPLNVLTKQGVRFSLEESGLILLDVARALVYIHKLSSPDGKPLKIVHRDVNPHNILLCADGFARLCDFGIAKSVLSQTHTRPGVFRGRFSYMAPEQLRGERPDFRADLYALGLVAFELFTGKRLFENRTVEDLFEDRAGAKERLTPYRQTLPKPVLALLDALLEEDRNNRPSDTTHALRLVENLVPDESQARSSLKKRIEPFLSRKEA